MVPTSVATLDVYFGNRSSHLLLFVWGHIRKFMKKIFYISTVTLFLTFIMILLGGIVKTTGSSLACPDWPTCNGSLVPPMRGAVAIEHSHRLLGTVIGILTALMVLFTVPYRKMDPKLHKAALLALVFVIIQGLLGGLTVLTRITPAISAFHLALSHLFFGVLLFVYYKSCEHREPPQEKLPQEIPSKFLRNAKIATVLVFVQICLGAIIRHYDLGGVCGLGWENSVFCADLVTGNHTVWPMNDLKQELHMLHRLNGILVLVSLIALTIPLLKFAKQIGHKSLRRLIIAIHAVVTLQVLVGISVVGTSIALHPITLHLALGLTLWALVLSVIIKLGNRGYTSGSLERIIVS